MNLDDLKGQLRPHEIVLLKELRATLDDYILEEFNEELIDWERIVQTHDRRTDVPSFILHYIQDSLEAYHGVSTKDNTP